MTSKQIAGRTVGEAGLLVTGSAFKPDAFGMDWCMSGKERG